MEKLIEKITEEVYKKVVLEATGSNKAHICGSGCTCSSKANGDIAAMIDHTLLKPDASAEQIKKLCIEARENKFASVCINPSYLPGQSAVVFGLGAIGYLTVQWLKSVGCSKAYAVDIFDDKLKLADRLGADYGINAKTQDVVKTIMELTNNVGVDAAIELAGSKFTQVQAIQVARKLGTVVYCGISYDDLVIPNSALARILRGELEVKGSWNSSIAPLPINEWESALIFMKNGKVKTDPLITHRFRLEDCQKAFNMMYNKTEVFTKVLFKPED